MQPNNRVYLFATSGDERKAPCSPFVDHARGTVGFGLTYGEYSYNHQPLFGAPLTTVGAASFAHAAGVTPMARIGSVSD